MAGKIEKDWDRDDSGATISVRQDDTIPAWTCFEGYLRQLDTAVTTVGING